MDARRWVWLVLVAGCGGEPVKPGPKDMAVAHDLAMPDLATAPDLAETPDMARTDDAGDVTQAHGAFHQFVVNRMQLPQKRTDFAIDLNGDGKVDNQLGNIVGALAAQGLDPQVSVDQAIADGTTVYLVSVQTADPMLMNDGMVGFTFYTGVPQAMPDFSGMGMFTVDNGVPPAKLFGTLVNGLLATNDPVKTLKPVTLVLKMALIGGQPPVELPINGAHVRADASVGGLVNGQMHGSVKESDVQMTLVPALANMLTAIVVGNPNSQEAQTIEQLFDVGGCQNPNGSQAKANDMRIDICEVSTNQIVRNLLAPDVDIFDANGNYAPNQLNTAKESLSLGFGFTAVPASF